MLFRSAADGYSYLLGQRGRPYAIWLANRTDVRLEAVVSVDGRDVISGRRADFREDRGYVLDPGEELRVDGFRRSLDDVAAFEFASPAESYAERMGDGSSVGVIGVAVFEEDRPGPPPAPIAGGGDRYDEERRVAPAQSPAALGATADRAAAEEPGLGTRYGRDRSSRAEIVPFHRLDPERPVEILSLFYDDREGLEARGIEIEPATPDPRDRCGGPDPFPGVPCDDRFAPPPPPVY